MKHFLIKSTFIPSIFGISDWNTPHGFLTEDVYFSSGFSLPYEYIYLENSFVETMQKIFGDLFSENIEYKYLYLQEISDSDFQKKRDEFLFTSTGLLKADIERKILSGEKKPGDESIYFGLYFRDLCRVCMVDKHSKSVISDSDDGLCFFVSVPSNYELQHKVTSQSLECIEWHDIFE